jgi:hypothetical protein
LWKAALLSKPMPGVSVRPTRLFSTTASSSAKRPVGWNSPG